MKKVYTTTLMLLFSVALHSQSIITLVNNPSADLDALISSKTNVSEENNNYQNSPDIGCGTWTYGSAGTGKNRSYLNFDWTQIPSNATIISAKLDLYSINMGWIIHGGHGGENESWIKRVVDSWDASTVTWNNQPGTSNSSAITLNKSTSSSQNYLNIDVTPLVVDMKSTGAWHGFAFVSKNESINGVLSFVSSNSSDSSKRPHLHITFSVPTFVSSMQEKSPDLLIYPNPSPNPTIVVSGYEGEAGIQLHTVTGQKVGGSINIKENQRLQVKDFTGGKDLERGIYIIRVKTANSDISKRIVIQ